MDLIDAKHRGAELQRQARRSRCQIGGEPARLAVLRDSNVAQLLYRIGHQAYSIRRTRPGDLRRVKAAHQIQDEGAARRACSTSRGAHVAIEIHAVVGVETDAAAIARNQGRLRRRGRRQSRGQIEHRRRPRCVESGTRPDNNESVARLIVDARTPKQDRATTLHYPVGPAELIGRDHGSPGNIEYGVLADPDRARQRKITSAARDLGQSGLVHHAVDRDLAARRCDMTVNRGLSVGQDGDSVPRIDRDRGVGWQVEIAQGGQRQVRADALDEFGSAWIFQIGGWQPQLGGCGQIAATARGEADIGEPIDRYHRRNVGSGTDLQCTGASDVVRAEARREQARIDRKCIARNRRVATDCDALPGAERQRAAAVEAVGAHAAVEHQRSRAVRAEIVRRAKVRIIVGDQADTAAGAALGLAGGEDGAAGGDVNDTAAGERDAAGGRYSEVATIDEGKTGLIVRVGQRVGPQPAEVDGDAGADGHRRRSDAAGERPPLHRLTARQYRRHDVAEGDAAAMGGDVGIERDRRRHEGELRAGRERQWRIDGDLVAGRDVEAAEPEAAECRRVEIRGAGTVGRQRIRRTETIGDRRHVVELHVGVVGPGEAEAGILSERQRAGERHRGLRQLVTIGDADRARSDLLFPIDHVGEDRALEDRAGCRQVEPAGIPSQGIAVLPAHAALAERTEIDLDNAPMRVVDHEAIRDCRIGQVGRGIVGVVDAAVTAKQIGLLNIAALVLNRATGDVEGGPLLRHHFRGRQCDAAADRGPFADLMTGVVEIAGDFEQAARGVVTIRRITAGAGRHQGQITRIDPDVAVDEHAAVAVLRTVPQLGALDVDLDRIGGHRQHRADRAGDVDDGAVFGEHALAGGGRHLPALGHGQRAVPEVDETTGHDLDPRLVLAVGKGREIVELAGGQAVGA